MALPVPNLDDRRFDDLVADARRLISQRCPEWTDTGPADPGMTLLEAVAYLTDQLLYRLNQVPDALYVRFLELIGLRLLPATPARADLVFWLTTPARAPMVVAAGTQAGTIRSDGDRPVVFRTTDDLVLHPSTVDSVRVGGAAGPRDAMPRLELAEPVPTFREPPVMGDELLVGLDVPTPRCAVRLDLDCRIDGVGVNPAHPPLVWEARTDEGWAPCDVSLDETGGLNRPGAVVLHVPAGHTATVLHERLAGWLRCRVVEPEEGQPPYSASPLLRGVSACTVGGTMSALHAELVTDDLLGESDGVPGQWFTLSRFPVLGGIGDPLVEVSTVDGWQQWHRVEHFAESGPDDRCYVLDAVAGQVLFGPAVRLPDGGIRQYGAVPPRGATVRAGRYAVGGGVGGNVAAHAVGSLRSSVPFVARVDNPRPAHGGRDGETLDQAKTRGPLLLRSRGRAVTAEDYQVLAREAAPEVARVRCVPGGDPDVAPGVVRVLVVPAVPARPRGVALEELVPSTGSLRRIAERLDQCRVAGTRVVVEPPLYRGVTVVARLVARSRVNVERVHGDALDALYGFLSPLPGGGPDGAGWPFGRPVQSGEIFPVLQRVRGVELVEDLRLFTADPVTGRRGREVTRVPLEPHSLIFSFEHQVRVEEH